MKKIDILNYITTNRTTPNAIRKLSDIKGHLGVNNEAQLLVLLEEMKQLRTLRELEVEGERAFQVTAK